MGNQVGQSLCYVLVQYVDLIKCCLFGDLLILCLEPFTTISFIIMLRSRKFRQGGEGGGERVQRYTTKSRPSLNGVKLSGR